MCGCNSSCEVVKQGHFSASARKPDGTKEDFGYARRTLSMCGNAPVMKNEESGVVTTLPAGTQVSTS